MPLNPKPLKQADLFADNPLTATPIHERLWKFVARGKSTDCWNWTGHVNKKGYGVCSIKRVYHMVHRIAYALAKGDIPERTLVCHKCDNPRCCNPDHLFLGDEVANMRDMLRKGRGNKLKGAQHNLAKLTDERVMEMRQLYAAGGHTCFTLASLFGVSFSQVCRIVKGKLWRHLPVLERIPDRAEWETNGAV